MSRIKDLTGKKFNKLSVIEYAGKTSNFTAIWKCQCDCGTILNVIGTYLSSNRVKSCGCAHKDAGKLRTKDMIGKRYGSLIVLEKAEKPEGKEKRGVYWLCLCDCGYHKIISGDSLRSGHIRSCGCQSLTGRFESKESTPFNTLYYGYKRSAKDRQLSFSLSEEDFLSIINKKCYYCGVDPLQEIVYKLIKSVYYYNGIDRLDSNKGYELDNVVPCCKVCNYAKREMTETEFKVWILKVYNNFIEGKV